MFHQRVWARAQGPQLNPRIRINYWLNVRLMMEMMRLLSDGICGQQEPGSLANPEVSWALVSDGTLGAWAALRITQLTRFQVLGLLQGCLMSSCIFGDEITHSGFCYQGKL